MIGLGLIALLATISAWVVSLILVSFCAVFVAFEFALVKVSVRELERAVEKGVSGSETVLAMKQDLNAMLAACQFGITLTSLGLTLALEPAIHHALADLGGAEAAAPALAMGFGAFFHVTFGELLPKGIALVVPARVLYATSTVMRIFRILSVPFIKTCNAIANGLTRALTGKNPDTAHHEDALEIDEALRVAQSSGQLEPNQLRLMRNILSFGDRTAREVMTPAREVVLLDLQRPWDENFRLAEEHGYSRFPVISGHAHNVVGYVRRAEMLKAELLGRRKLDALVLPIERRPETAKLPLLNLFKGRPMIAIFDEHDSFSGLLTAEDVIEQIVGEIYDDTDDLAPPLFEDRPDGTIRVDGSVLLEDATQRLGLVGVEEHNDVDTLGGLVLKLLGRQPIRGDAVQFSGFTATVEDTRGFRVLWLVLRPDVLPEPDAVPVDGAPAAAPQAESAKDELAH